MGMKRNLIIGCIVTLLAGAAYSATMSIPHVFVSGDIADPDEVNANFTAAQTAIGLNDAEITAVENTGAANANAIDVVEADILDLEAGTSQTLGGDLSGTLSLAVVGDDSHSHTTYIDPTAEDALTWDGGTASGFVWTWDLLGTDPTLTFGSDLFTFGGDVTLASGKKLTIADNGAFKLPVETAPSLSIGELTLDDTITGFDDSLKYSDGSAEFTVLAIPSTGVPTTDEYVLKYDATADELVFEAELTGGEWTDATGTIHLTQDTDTLCGQAACTWSITTAGAADFPAGVSGGSSGTPTIGFDDTGWDDTGGDGNGDEARIVANAAADNDGSIVLQVEDTSDNNFINMLEVESNGGSPRVILPTLSCSSGEFIQAASGTGVLSCVAQNVPTATHTVCKTMYAPASPYIADTDDIEAIWRAPANVEITEVYCQTDQTVTLDLQIDNGTPTDVMGADLNCTTGASDSTALTGGVDDGWTVDLLIATATGNPTKLTVCFEYTYD
jgi:hypothetical protein